MSEFKTYILIWLLLECLVTVTNCHPQCLDFRAPFRPDKNLNMCSAYSEFGCCGSHDDYKIKEEYEYIRSRVPEDNWNRCQDNIKEILCQKCSPYAAHIYDAEGTSQARVFPGLCIEYCHNFYDQCRDLVWLLDPRLGVAVTLTHRDTFCKHVAITDAIYCYPDLLTSPLLLRNLTMAQNLNATSGCLCLETIKNNNLANPLWARHAGDGSGRLFVAEQKGRVRIYSTRTKKWIKNCFLDFTSKAEVSSSPGDERGFLGLAFHPKYASNGRFFVYYSTSRKPRDVLPPEIRHSTFTFKSKIVISEAKVSESDPNKADPNFERVLLEVFQPYENHNGGELMFGLDGYLYAFIGDGGGAGDPMRAGQNKSLLLGKVIRIDVDSDPTKPYTIPRDNPFVEEPGSRPEIYAYGVRNIWRCGLDKGGEFRGRILCGDVGQNAHEEINVLKAGANYGWNSREGFACYDDELCGRIGQEELPIHAYSHMIGQSVTGGVFYRGCENPALVGQYIYGDYASSRMFSLTESNGVWTNRDVNLCASSLCQGGLVGSSNDFILSFGEDEDGEIYMLTSKSTSSKNCDGNIYKIVDPIRRNDPTSCISDLTRKSRVPLSRRGKMTTEKDRHIDTLATITIRIRTRTTNTNRTFTKTLEPSSMLSSFSTDAKHLHRGIPKDNEKDDRRSRFPQSSLLTQLQSRSTDQGVGISSASIQVSRQIPSNRKRSSGRIKTTDDHSHQNLTTRKPKRQRKQRKKKAKKLKKPSKCGICEN